MATFVDDKIPHCESFILSRLAIHRASPNASEAFFIGLNGVQGAGKTTLVSALDLTLRERGLQVLVCSIDDLYLRHEDQVQLASAQNDNPLVQHRGEPGTHDMDLAATLFSALRAGTETKVPVYNKALFSGAGDRTPVETWKTVNNPSQPPVQVIIFEGWCVGFRALAESEVLAKQAVPGTILNKHRPADLLFVNEKLKGYDVMTDCFDAFVHIDAEETVFVYEWRLQQEVELRKATGSGMSDELVREFVDGYYPAYELYTEGVRKGVLRGKKKADGAQLTLVVGKDRKVRKVISL